MIRPAVVADAAAIAHAHLGGWLAAYRGIMSDEVLDNLDFAARRARWHDNLANGARVLVDEHNGAVRGFANYGPCRDKDKLGAGEVYALYVDQEWWGQGVGEGLLSAARHGLHNEGYADFVLWVLRDNARARAFYEKQGWLFDGTEQVSQWGPVEARHVYQATA